MMDKKITILLLGVVMIVLVLFYVNKRRKIDIFDPFYWSSAVYFAVMVIAPYSWILSGKNEWHGATVMDNLIIATLFFSISYFSFVIGSISKNGNRLKQRSAVLIESNNSIENDPRFKIFAWLVFILGVVLSLLYLRYRGRTLLTSLTLGTMGSFKEDMTSSGSFWFLNQGTRVMMVGCMLLFMVPRKNKLITFLAYVFTFMLVLSSGKRNQLMVVVLAPIVLLYLCKRKRPKWSLVFAFIGVFIVVLGLIGIWRSTFFHGGTLEKQSMDSIIESFMVNIEVFFPYYTMISTVPSVFPHQLGLSYLYTFIQFIPRALWSGKPVSAVTNVTIAMFGAYASYGPAYPNFAEMYLDFSLPGMIVGMCIFGIVSSKIYNKGIDLNATVFDKISLAMFLPYLFEYITRGHFPSVATEVLFLWGPMWGCKWLLKTNFLKKTLKSDIQKARG